MSNKKEVDYWNNFYNSNNTIKTCSDFCNFVIKFFHNNKEIVKVLDCGCGNGRDSYELSKLYNVDAIDNNGILPVNNNNTTFYNSDFINYNKNAYQLIYSRFTFHSITDEQQLSFLDSINVNSYLAIETRSKKGEDLDVVHGKTHFRNYTDYNYLKDILKSKNFDIIFIAEGVNMAIYKNENPICIRVICKKIA